MAAAAPTLARTFATLETSTSSASPRSLDPTVQAWSQSSHPAHPNLKYETFQIPIDQSPLDDRQYRLVRLANGLEAMLIHDPTTDKSTAAMDVKVGHLMDPAELPGCAHFCEHLLFLGTEKFPRENEYSEFLSAHGGNSNAFTGMDNTNYYFSCSPSALSGALERFSQFFVAPLFDPSCTERELKAVDSEHSKNLQNDMWRGFQLEKSLAKEGHEYGKFGTGNWKSLWEDVKARGGEPRDELLKWWNDNYCAGRMKLVVLGKEPLDELEGQVVELFSPVPNKSLPPVISFKDDLFETSLATTTFMKTIKDLHSLELSWVIPDQSDLFRSKPGNFLSHFLGHEGPGSVLSYLKKQGWINGLSAGPSEGASGWAFLRVSADLTPEGLENYEAVSTAIFSYLSLLSKSGPQPEAFREIQSLSELSFAFAEKASSPSDYASDLASNLSAPWPREWSLSTPYLTREFDGEAFKKTLDLLTIERCRITLSSQALPKSVAGTWDKKEPIYGTEYKVEKFSDEFLDAAKKAVSIDAFHLPKPNEFIPKDTHVEKIEGITPREVPALIRETALSELWYKKDDRFWVPRANFWVGLRSPLLNSSALNAASARLFVDLYGDHMTEQLYDADLAGLRSSVMYSGSSIILSTMGYNDKLAALTTTAIKELKEFKVDPKRFELLKDDLRRDWSNHELGEPYNLSNYYGYYLAEPKMYTPQEKLAVFDQITVESIEQLAKQILSRLHIQTLVHGNMSREAAVELQQVIEDALAADSLTSEEKKSDTSLILPEASSHVWPYPLPNKANPNSGVSYYIQVGTLAQDPSLRPLTSLFAQIAKEPCFDTLRTKEQLGYLVSSSPVSHSGSVGYQVLVQSQNDASYLEERIESWLRSMEAFIEALDADEFEKQKRSLVDEKLRKVKNLYEESSRIWKHIGNGYFDFDVRTKEAAAILEIDKSALLTFFRTYISPSSSTRRKASVHLRTQFAGPAFDPATAQPLIGLMMMNQIPVPMAELQALMGRNPPPSVHELQAFARTCVAQREGLDDAIKGQLEGMIAALSGGVVAPKEGKLREENVLIQGDVREWKRKLVETEPATPVVPLDSFRD